MSRRPLVVGNWKMSKTRAEAASYCAELAAGLPEVDGVEVGLCPPFTAIATVAEALQGTGVLVCGQNVHQAESGAFTGEISVGMLIEAGAAATLLGHSERRALFNEHDPLIAEKIPACLDGGLMPILCIGELAYARDAGSTNTILDEQLRAGLAQATPEQIGRLTVAYEPVWAIGTGRTATPEVAQETIAALRARVRARFGDAAAVNTAWSIIIWFMQAMRKTRPLLSSVFTCKARRFMC
jgi:triosephosphate isomerase